MCRRAEGYASERERRADAERRTREGAGERQRTATHRSLRLHAAPIDDVRSLVHRGVGVDGACKRNKAKAARAACGPVTHHYRIVHDAKLLKVRAELVCKFHDGERGGEAEEERERGVFLQASSRIDGVKRSARERERDLRRTVVRIK